MTDAEIVAILDAASERCSFNPHAHRYKLLGSPIPGVTTVIRSKDAPALDRWKVKVQYEADVKAAWDLLIDGGQWESFDKFAAAFKYRSGEEMEHEKQSREAADIGKAVHSLLEAHWKTALGIPFECPPVGDEAHALFSAVLDWLRMNDLHPIAIERRVYSESNWYAGTGDLFARYQGRLVLADYKSSKYGGGKIWPEHRLQSAAYRKAAQEIGLPEMGGLILKLPKDGAPVEAVDISDTIDVDFRAFLACRELYQYDKLFT